MWECMNYGAHLKQWVGRVVMEGTAYEHMEWELRFRYTQLKMTR